jgi:hypothetical protein
MSDVAFPLDRADTQALDRPQRVLSPFEFWPAPVFYAPVFAYWICLGLRHGSLTLPTIANPEMEGGGICGESKTELFASMSAEGRRWLAPYVSARRGGRPTVEDDRACLLRRMREAGLDFPVVAKPDVGCHGAGVRVLREPSALRGYLEAFPSGERLLLQRLIDCEGEAGIFYVRRPGEQRGRIFSFTLKFFPQVLGDGSATLEQLILRDPRAGRVSHLYLPRHRDRLGWVPAPGEKVRLVFAGNHCKGAIFRNGISLVTPALTARFDQLAKTIPSFHFGRFDVRFDSLSRLLAGEDFTVIEFNGGGSEAIHVWDPDTRLLEAYRDLFDQVRLLFEIGAANRAAGRRPDGWRRFLAAWRRERRLERVYPMTE